LGDQHPDFNHGPWTQDETTKLRELIAEHGNEQVDWEAVADKLGVRLLLQSTKKEQLSIYHRQTEHRWTA
jgi:hypothetical protein